MTRMTPPRRQQVTAALVVGLAVAACSRASRQLAPLSPVARARADSARHPYTAADVSFMSHMIGHHAQAIVMAGWAASHGASPSVRTLAARISNAQRDEIAFMQQWLRNRRSEEHTSELQSLAYLVCRLLLEKKKIFPELSLRP